MLRRFFQLSPNGSASGNSLHIGPSSNGTATAEPEGESEMSQMDRAGERKRSTEPGSAAIAGTIDFDQIYQSAAAKPPHLTYGILKVADMAGSQHLAGMSPEAKRSCLLMALEAAGQDVDYLLEDAAFRQRALNDHEEIQIKKLKAFEATKTKEIGRIQAELERITAQSMASIQANLDELARQQDILRAWQKRKQQESQRITEAATFCLPPGTSTDGLNTLLERAATSRR